MFVLNKTKSETTYHVEDLLQFLVGKIDTELLKAVNLECFEPVI